LTTSNGVASEKDFIFSSDGASFDVRSLKIKLAGVRKFLRRIAKAGAIFHAFQL
jgi:hypothetical protein